MRIIYRTAIAFGAAALVSGGAFAAEGDYIRGVVTDVDIAAYMNTLTIEDSKTGKQHIFEVLPATKITLENGRSGTLAQVDEGDTVKLDVFEDNEGRWVLTGFSREYIRDGINVETEAQPVVATDPAPAEPAQPFVVVPETEARYEIASAYNESAYDRLPDTATALPNLLLGALGLFATAGGIRLRRRRRIS